jgi:hypothetical protein
MGEAFPVGRHYKYVNTPGPWPQTCYGRKLPGKRQAI